MNYYERKKLCRTFNSGKSETDQSQAASTDINVIVNQLMKYGEVTNAKEGIYGDFSELPSDLRGFLDTARSLNRNRKRLPHQLTNLSIAELTALTRDQITTMLTPPEPKPENEEKK